MAERIRQVSNPPPRMSLNVFLQLRPGRHRRLHRRVDLLHHEVEMDRSPVAPILTNLRAARVRRAARLLHEQINRRRSPEHLDPTVPEPAPDVEPQAISIEAN